MPQSSQIIPSHLFPHEKVVVNDNTTYTQVVSEESNDSVKMLFVFASPKGKDNRVITIDGGFSQFLNEFGQGAFSLYGQPYLNAYNAFSTGNIVGHCMRVTADNATYAYSNLVALYKVDEAGKMTVKFKTKAATTDLTSLDAIEDLYTAPTGVITGEDNPDAGYTEVKLLTVASLGKGAYGKKLLYSISTNTGSDKENAYKNYIFNVYENFTSLLQKESYAICFNEDAIVDNESIFTDGVINDPDNGSSRIKVVTNVEGFAQLFNAYKDANPDTVLTLETFDALLGINKYSKEAITNYEVDTTSADVVVVNSLSGIALEGGSDGDFGESVDPEVRKAALEAAYLKAYSGETDPLIASKNKYPTNLILDANFPIETKQAILALTEKRGDCMCVVDCGTAIKTKIAPVTYVKNNLAGYATHRNQMVDAIVGKVRDPYSKKIVTVTNTLLLASEYPTHWVEHNGKHVPYAGNTYGVIDGFLKESIYPVYDEDIDADLMDELCEERINFARINARQEVIRATQTTRQTSSSALSEANNVFILLDIKRDCEKLCATYHYNFSEASDIARFNKDVETVLSDYANSQVRKIEASFDKNDWEAARGILHLYVGFEHKDLVKTTIIEIDVNRAGSETTV
jgi:hypothetical protein